MAIKLAQPFERTVGFPIDNSIVLTSAEMLAVDDSKMPDMYFALNSDDGKMYVYDKRNTPNAITGKYRAIDSGGGGGDKTYEFVQSTPSNRWQILHSLNKFPSVTIVDSAGSVVVGDIQYVDLDQIIITFQAPFAGKAYLN